MVSTLHRKLLRELKSSGGLLLMITSILAIGIGCYVALRSVHRNLTEAQSRYYAQCRMADFTVEVKKAPLSAIAALGELPGVDGVRPRVQFYATVDLPSVAKPLNGLVLSLPDVRENVISDIVLRCGGYFTDRRQNEVIVNEAFARQHKIAPGHWIHLLLNNRRQELFVVGTAISSEFIYLVGPGTFTPDPEHFGVFYIKQTFADEVFDFDGAANQALCRLARGTGGAAAQGDTIAVPPATREALRRAELLLAPYGVLSTSPLADQPSNRYVSNEIRQLETFGVVLPTIFLAVVMLVLNVLLTRLVEHQRVVTGTLKALGYGDARLALHFVELGLIVGLLGGLMGCTLGHYLAEYMTRMYRQFYQFPELPNRFHLGIHATAVLVGVVCAVVGCLRGCRAVLRLRPAEAMRAKPPVQGRAVLLERIGWFWRRLTPGWRMVLRDLMRTRMRTAAGVLAGALGAAVLVNTLMMAEAVQVLIDFQFRWILRSDLDLTLKDERGAATLDEAARLPGVDRAEPTLDVACTFRNGNRVKKGSITGILPDATLTIPRDRQARAIRVPATGLAMNRTLAEILGVQRGDTIEVQPTKGRRRAFRAPVAEIVDGYLGTSVYAEIHTLSRLVDEELAISSIQLATSGKPEETAALYRELKRLPGLQAVNARQDMIRNLEDTVVRTLWVSLGLLILFAGLVFFGSILNSSMVSLAEREREVATFRVLGYGPWEIGNILLRESLIVTLFGTLLGMPLGYLLTLLSVSINDNELFRIPVISSPLTWLGSFALAVVFTFSAHLVVQRTIHRMNWLEALQAKE